MVLISVVQVVKSLQALWQFVVYDFPRSAEKKIIKQNFAKIIADIQKRHKRGTVFKDSADTVFKDNTDTIFKDSVVLPDAGEKGFYKQLKRLQTTLETKDTMLSVPKGLEARRRITFFSNSLFMSMPRAPQVYC